MEIGLNLYSTRDRMRTKEDFLCLAKELKEQGCSYVQFSGSPISYAEAKEVVEKTGLPITLTHADFNRIVTDTEAIVKEHFNMGCKNIGIGSIPADVRNFDEVVFKVKRMEEAAQKIEAMGGRFFCHNHSGEFYRMKNGQTVFDYILENAPHVNITLDTYWVQYGGADVIDVIRRAKGRIGCVHLKDYQISEALTPAFAPVGYGNMDFKKITEEMKKAGTEFFFIEQDNVPEIENGYDDIRKSFDYVRENL